MRFSNGLNPVLCLLLLAVGCNSAPKQIEFKKSVSSATGADAETSEDDQSSGEESSESEDTSQDDEAVSNLPNELLPSITDLKVTNADGASPVKGDKLKVVVSLTNQGKKAGSVELVPKLSGKRFTDFTDVQTGKVSADLGAGESKDVSFEISYFIEDASTSKRFALGRGDYELKVEVTGVSTSKSKAFEIGKGKAVFTLILFDSSRYFQLDAAKGVDPVKWMEEVVTRRSSVYDQSSKTRKIYEGGFDEILGIKHVFMPVDKLGKNDGADVFDKPEALATSWLGMSDKWSHGSGPGLNKHGYDYFIAMDSDFGGGVTYGAAQVSGMMPYDLSKDRLQVIAVHESGHVFGAPHCDPIQGYVMCSGEKHDEYKKTGEFVWLDDSVKSMKNIFLDY